MHFQRFTALLLALVLSAGLLVLPAGAEDAPVSSRGTIWSDWAKDMPEFWGKVLTTVTGMFDNQVCPVSSDHLHHGKVYKEGSKPGVWLAKCDYCNDSFSVYDDDMQNAYNEHVNKVQETLGTTQVGVGGIYIVFSWNFIFHWFACG